MTEQLMLSFIKSLGKVDRLMYFTLVKRIIGLFILLATLLLNANLLVYGYLVTTVIGCAVNVLLYSFLTKQHTYKVYRHILNNMLPSFFIFIICQIIGTYFCVELYIRIFIVAIFMCTYYMLYLRIRGINVVNIVKSFL